MCLPISKLKKSFSMYPNNEAFEQFQANAKNYYKIYHSLIKDKKGQEMNLGNGNSSDILIGGLINEKSPFSGDKLKEEIKKWFFSLSLESRTKMATVESEWICSVIFQMYKNYYLIDNSQTFKMKELVFSVNPCDEINQSLSSEWNNKAITKINIHKLNQKEIAPKEDYTTEFDISDSSTIFLFEFKSNNKESNSDLKAKEDILSDVKFCSIHHTQDCMTLSPNILLDENKFETYFKYFGSKNYFENIIKPVYIEKSKQYNYSLPEWMKISEYYSLVNYILAFVEQAILIKFVLYLGSTIGKIKRDTPLKHSLIDEHALSRFFQNRKDVINYINTNYDTSNREEYFKKTVNVKEIFVNLKKNLHLKKMIASKNMAPEKGFTGFLSRKANHSPFDTPSPEAAEKIAINAFTQLNNIQFIDMLIFHSITVIWKYDVFLTETIFDCLMKLHEEKNISDLIIELQGDENSSSSNVKKKKKGKNNPTSASSTNSLKACASSNNNALFIIDPDYDVYSVYFSKAQARCKSKEALALDNDNTKMGINYYNNNNNNCSSYLETVGKNINSLFTKTTQIPIYDLQVNERTLIRNFIKHDILRDIVERSASIIIEKNGQKHKDPDAYLSFFNEIDVIKKKTEKVKTKLKDEDFSIQQILEKNTFPPEEFGVTKTSSKNSEIDKKNNQNNDIGNCEATLIEEVKKSSSSSETETTSGAVTLTVNVNVNENEINNININTNTNTNATCEKRTSTSSEPSVSVSVSSTSANADVATPQASKKSKKKKEQTFFLYETVKKKKEKIKKENPNPSGGVTITITSKEAKTLPDQPKSSELPMPIPIPMPISSMMQDTKSSSIPVAKVVSSADTPKIPPIPTSLPFSIGNRGAFYIFPNSINPLSYNGILQSQIIPTNYSKIYSKDFLTFDQKLHNDILTYNEQVSTVVDATVKIKEYTIKYIEDLISGSMEDSFETDIYGSFASGLTIEASDIDIKIKMSNCQNKITYTRHLEQIILTLVKIFYEVGKFESVVPIHTASVPLIKLVIDPLKIANEEMEKVISEFKAMKCYVNYLFSKDEIDKIKIDLTFIDMSNWKNKTNSISSVEYAKGKSSLHPQVIPILRIMKRYLLEKKMNNCFSGGLSSFCLFLMIIAYVQFRGLNQPTAPNNLGRLFLDFLQFYGKIFTFRSYSIDVNIPNPYVMISSPSLFRDSISSLVIIDPLTLVNASKSSFKIDELQLTFSNAFDYLSNYKIAYDKSGYDNMSMMNNIIYDLIHKK